MTVKTLYQVVSCLIHKNLENQLYNQCFQSLSRARIVESNVVYISSKHESRLITLTMTLSFVFSTARY